MLPESQPNKLTDFLRPRGEYARQLPGGMGDGCWDDGDEADRLKWWQFLLVLPLVISLYIPWRLWEAYRGRRNSK